MSRKNNKRKGSNDQRTKLVENVKVFANYSFKKYKKRMKGNDFGDESKKELKRSYYDMLNEYLFPDTIEWLLKFGYHKDAETTELREAVYEKLRDQKYIKYLTRTLEKFQDTKKKKKKRLKIYGFEGVEYLPIIIRDIVIGIDKLNQIKKSENNTDALEDTECYIKLSSLIMERPIKKMMKKGISEKLAFNVLSIMPTSDSLKYSPKYRMALLFNSLYESSKGSTVPFNTVINYLVKDNEETEFAVLLFALLERKEKFGSLTDNQKKLYIDISNWVFDTLERKDKDFISDLLLNYVKSRKIDDSQGKDGNRRYALSSLSETEYSNITSVMKSLILNDESVKKYF